MSTITELRNPKDSNAKHSVQFKHVVMATDFSDASQRALAFASAVAGRYGCVLSVVHAIPPEARTQIPLDRLPPELNRRRLEEQMKQIEARVWAHDCIERSLIEQGPVWEVLASVLRREGVDLLVLGTHGRGGLKKLALGSVAEEVLRLATCPVLTVGPHVPAAEAGTAEFRRILFATDFGPACAKAFPYALALAEDYQAKLVLLHMIPPVPGIDLGTAAYGPSAYATEDFTKWQRTIRKDSLAKLSKLVPPDTRLAAEPEYVVGTDFLAEGILDTAEARASELIVMGVNQTSSPRVAAHMPWDLMHEVIGRAKCPVLTVRN
jgi:nucleotide-binding universal stress UspA family protein